MPAIPHPEDAIVPLTRTTICGTDLHILKGDVPICGPGTILGHEGVGVVDTAGPAVAGFRPGDRVPISCITSCGRCDYCRKGMYSHCLDGGWIPDNRIDGTQAEYMRIPHADFSLRHIPDGADTVIEAVGVPPASRCAKTSWRRAARSRTSACTASRSTST